MNLRLLKKGANTKLHEYDWLTQKEVDCNCTASSCTQTFLYERTFNSFIATRKEYGRPIQVTSWNRCQVHNLIVKGEDDSFHKVGCACDLIPRSPEPGELEKLAEIARKHFDVVILYKDKNFIHCHNEPCTDWDWYTGSKQEKCDYDAEYEYGMSPGSYL